MKKSFVQKHPYIATVLIGLLCTFMTVLGMAIPQIMRLDMDFVYIISTVFLVISVVLGIVIMKKSRFNIHEYGFRRSENKSNSKVWWYAPLVLIEILPIAIFGFSSIVTPIQYIIFVFFTIAVGFNEEIYFRALALKFMEEKGRKKAIIWSSVVFGVLHIVNALNGKNMLYLVLQMLFAFLVGFILAEIVSITKSLWMVIIWHATHDFIASITEESLDQKALIVIAIQVTILFVYAISIWKKSTVEDKVIFDLEQVS